MSWTATRLKLSLPPPGYTFGILKTQDRSNTDQTLNQVSQEQELTLKTREYDGLAQLADALSGGEVGAILLNQAYLSLFDELPGYEDFPGQLRVLSTQDAWSNRWKSSL